MRPTNPVYTIDAEGAAWRRWWLIPRWAKEEKSRYPTFNARSESVAQKASFKQPWRQNQRCLIPASAYFEWPVVEGRKILHRIHPGAPEIFWIAGLWESWQGPAGEVQSCTILTREPREDIAWIHNRMPCLLSADQLDDWLHGDSGEAADLLKQAYPGDIQATLEVSKDAQL